MRESDGLLSLTARLEVVVMAVVVAVTLVGVALLPIATPGVVRALVTALHSERDAGLTVGQTRDVAASVLDFVTDVDAPALPVTVAGRPGFDAFATSHLVDVRNVLVPARLVALALAALVVAWALVRRRTAVGRQAAGAALSGGGALLLGAGALVVLAGALDFDRLFTQFHGVFFEAGTWTFPADALLIQVFPLRFWIAAGGLWAALALMLAVAALVVGRRFGFTRGRYGV